jgi:IMP dehydrogenase
MVKWWDNGLESLTYDDILIRPAYSQLSSRTDASTNVYLKVCNKEYIVQPIIPANMITIATEQMIHELSKLDIIVPAQRFQSKEEELASIKLSKPFFKAASVGIKERDRTEFIAPHVDILFLELAHAHSKQAIEEAKWIIRNYPEKLLVVGNVATADACKAFRDVGVNMCKIGIGPGATCKTRTVTGCGVPQLSAVLECAPIMPVIADGGIKNSGDCIKALAAGASFVMIGSLFAGTDEAGTQRIKGKGTKIYLGMASNEAGRVSSGNVPEGVAAEVPYSGNACEVANELLAGIRQGMAMVGAKNLEELREKAVFQRVSGATIIENQPHILFRK